MNDLARRESLTTIIGLLVLVALFVFAVYLPGRRDAARLRNEIADAEQSLDEVPIRKARLAALRRKRDQRRKALQQNHLWLSSRAEQYILIRDVAQLAETTPLTVNNFEPKEVRSYQSYQVIPFRLSFRGRFAGVVALLRELESRQRLLTIEEFTLSKSPEFGPGRIEGSIRFLVYMRRAESGDSAENHLSSRRPAADNDLR